MQTLCGMGCIQMRSVIEYVCKYCLNVNHIPSDWWTHSLRCRVCENIIQRKDIADEETDDKVTDE